MLEGFQTPFSQHLNLNNRWVKLAHCIPWDKLANVYYRKMNSDFGAPSLDARMVIGAVIIKHMLNLDDREVVAQIQENMYLQYFVGLSSFTTEEPFDASLMVSIRYRLGQDVMEAFNNLVLQEAGVIPKLSDENQELKNRSQKSEDDLNEIQEPKAIDDTEEETKENEIAKVPNSGTLLVDATIAEQQMEYPTDLKMLNETREQLERIIEQVCKEGSLHPPRMYKKNARKDYLGLAKKKKKTKKNIRKGLRAQLQYVSRDLKYINKLLDENTSLKATLNKRDWKLLQVIHEVYRQQKQMYTEDKRSIEDRIVSLYQPHVRPMPRGKDRVQTEFGSKQLVMLKDGFTHVQKISWDNFYEGVHLQECVEKYKELYGCYPEKVSVDGIFGNKENRRYLKEKGIMFVGKQLGRPPKMTSSEKRKLQKEMAGRNAIEGKFGQGKNRYGLEKIKARMKETSESWILSIYFIMNLVKLSERTFLRLFKNILQHFISCFFAADQHYGRNKLVSLTP
jgi:IS5 family transposase